MVPVCWKVGWYFGLEAFDSAVSRPYMVYVNEPVFFRHKISAKSPNSIITTKPNSVPVNHYVGRGKRFFAYFVVKPVKVVYITQNTQFFRQLSVVQAATKCWEESSALNCTKTKTVSSDISNDWNDITSKKPGTVLSMQNRDLGRTKVMKIRQRETLSDQGAIIHEVCCCTAQ